jgi:hypothetical protein
MVEDDASAFQAEVRACAEEIRALLPALAQRHSPLIVLAALSEHVGGALHLCQEAGACTQAEARAVFQRLEQMTFEEGAVEKPAAT